jgi:hypothetical protein
LGVKIDEFDAKNGHLCTVNNHNIGVKKLALFSGKKWLKSSIFKKIIKVTPGSGCFLTATRVQTGQRDRNFKRNMVLDLSVCHNGRKLWS